MKKLLIIINTLFILSNCETALEIEIPSIQSKLVINSYITPGKNGLENFSAHVSNSIEGMGSSDQCIYTDSVPAINNATATIQELNTPNNSIINQYELEFSNNCYCYNNREFIPKENTTYRLVVSTNNHPEITALETTPNNFNYTIENFNLSGKLDSVARHKLCDLNIKIEDTPNQNNYYRLKIVAVLDDSIKSCIYKVQDPSFLIPINRYGSNNNYYEGRGGYFTDELFEGQEKDFFVEVDKPEGAFSHFYIEITSYSENLYNFNLTRREQNRDNNNFIFNSEPIFINSNINEGYGIFGARIIKSQAYLPTYFPINGWIEY